MRAVVGPGEVTLNWRAPAFNSQTITRYEYTYKEGADGAYRGYVPAGTDPKKTSYKVTGLKPDTEYTFRVRARNSAGAGDHLEFAPVTPGDTAPTSAPTLSTTLGTTTDVNVPRITLSWTKVPDANNGGEPIPVAGYAVQFTTEADPDDDDWTAVTPGSDGFSQFSTSWFPANYRPHRAHAWHNLPVPRPRG